MLPSLSTSTHPTPLGHSWSLSSLCHPFQTFSFFSPHLLLLVALPFLFSPLLYCPFSPQLSYIFRTHPPKPYHPLAIALYLSFFNSLIFSILFETSYNVQKSVIKRILVNYSLHIYIEYILRNFIHLPNLLPLNGMTGSFFFIFPCAYVR